MYTATFVNYGSEYDIFGAICLLFQREISRSTWNLMRKGNKIEKYIMEEYKGDNFGNLDNIANYYKINICVYWRKMLVYKTETAFKNTLLINTANEKKLENLKVVLDASDLIYR